ncbi:BnaA08g29740D [Brassica napus]|uniref:BnaA08g29740D protein n=1 Tax=Brassica napus TaxID=3708 RepID=A0A078I919_BRANA|nr:BnaA08g29740D [Brassica napus]
MAEENSTETSIICYAPSMITTNGVWQGDNPLDFSLPLFVLQLTLVVVVTRFFVFVLKPFRQPRVISEILGGIVLGPSVLGRYDKFANTIFPQRSVMVLETMANVGLLYFLFLVGVEMDIMVVRKTGKRALTIALGGMVLPFVIGAAFSFSMQRTEDHLGQGTYILFLGVALSVTAFPVLARILAELKLINTEIALAIALAESEKSSFASLWVMISSAAFIAICVFVVRPGISWIIRKTPEGENFSEFYICLILTGVMICGFITDSIGTHSVFGAFVFGLVIPNGPLGLTLIEKLEDFVSGLLLPLFFAISGLKTNVAAIQGPATWVTLFLVIFLACTGKVIGTVVVAFFHGMPVREGITLGLLLNTKGLVEMIVLNVGKDQKVLDDETFATMVLIALVMTGVITPIVTVLYKPVKRSVSYKRRTIQQTKPDSELRVLVCIHTPRNVPTIINLLEASHPTKRSPICIYVLHLVELTGRASAMLIVHNTRKSGKPALNRTQAQSDHIINAFENYEQHAAFVAVQPLTAISPYSTMHEDVCSLAEDKRVSFIIIPFHKQQTVDGGMEATNPAYRLVNQNLLGNSPCSVGILVDRGLNGATRLTSNTISLQVAVLFFGGPDDREALAYAWRMAEHPGISLTVLRFIPDEDVTDAASTRATNETDRNMNVDMKKQRQLDDEYVNTFRAANTEYETIVYIDKVVSNGEETVAAVRSMDSSHDLFIVGRGEEMSSPLTAGLTDWSECPELGAIGDLLASSDFAATVSVLVVQQYVGPWAQDDDMDLPDSPVHSHDQPNAIYGLEDPS